MKNIVIISDSTCDLSQDIIDKYDIKIVPLIVNFDDESYKDGVDIDSKKLFSKVDEYGKLPKTSAISPAVFLDTFKPYIDNGKDIIYIGISSKLSSTLQSAHIAASEFDKGRIEIVDSQNLSSAIGLLVIKAAKYVNEGFSVSEVAEKVRKLVPKVQCSFVINTMEYLYKGGRCSSVESLIGTMLKIKPIIKVVDGGMIAAQKARGKKVKALDIMLKNLKNDTNGIDKDAIMITHSQSDEDVPYLRQEIGKIVEVENIYETCAGSVISSHCGPGTIGILYINE